ncbi:MAG: hypothetical protein U9O18_07625 [Chloroflexota bacterium]|nr:hypothetical protein [Chloroflexota bacterium]
MEDFGFAEFVIIAVILSRLLVPLLIIRWPLPAIVASLIIDAVDQTVFSAVAPNADLAGYQTYDKALDIYYLVIAYISTLRNWTNRFALEVARFLIYYRLIGVVLFELSGIREILFIFPNTFEYFFIFYESVRLFWDPRRMSRKVVIGAAAFIWIFIKLPQEWWIHIAQLDLTDFVQEKIFGVEAGAPWIDTFAAKPWIVVIAIVVVAALIYAGYWLMKNKLPARDRPLTIDADAEPGREVNPERLRAERERMAKTVLRPGLFEKVALIALVGIIFGEVFQVRADPLELSIIMAVIVVANATLSTLLERRGFGPTAALRQFFFTGLLNLGIFAAIVIIFEVRGTPVDMPSTFFYLLLITLLVTLYDRYRPEYLARYAEDPEPSAT